MPRRQILLLAGKINSGKDFTSDLLVHEFNWVKIPFAEHLKKLTATKFDIPIADLYTQEGKKIMYNDVKSYRDMLIDTAKIYRDHDEDFFVNSVIERIKVTPKVNIVISDFRYPNEYNRIVSQLSGDFDIKTGLVVRNTDFIILNHPSETSLKNFNFNFTIQNNGYDQTLLFKDLCHILNLKPT